MRDPTNYANACLPVDGGLGRWYHHRRQGPQRLCPPLPLGPPCTTDDGEGWGRTGKDKGPVGGVSNGSQWGVRVPFLAEGFKIRRIALNKCVIMRRNVTSPIIRNWRMTQPWAL
eukprot:454954-Pelagomonas_calceolata.AAC.1